MQALTQNKNKNKTKTKEGKYKQKKEQVRHYNKQQHGKLKNRSTLVNIFVAYNAHADNTTLHRYNLLGVNTK